MSHVYKAIKERHDKARYHQLTEEIENPCENLKVDISAQRMYTLMLYCAEKVSYYNSSSQIFQFCIKWM